MRPLCTPIHYACVAAFAVGAVLMLVSGCAHRAQQPRLAIATTRPTTGPAEAERPRAPDRQGIQIVALNADLAADVAAVYFACLRELPDGAVVLFCRRDAAGTYWPDPGRYGYAEWQLEVKARLIFPGQLVVIVAAVGDSVDEGPSPEDLE